MDWSGIIQNCKKCCAMVQITGRDSLNKKNIGFPSSKSENGITSLSGSGVVVSKEKGLIITTGSIIIPFLVHDDSTKLPKDNKTLISGTNVSVLLPQTSGQDTTWHEGELVGVWGCESIGRHVRKLNTDFQYKLDVGWKEVNTDASSIDDGNVTMLNVEYIAVIRLMQPSLPLTEAKFSNSNKLALGQPIAVVASPFGCISTTTFFNSISSGVISHLFQNNDHTGFILTDARCLPGTEGGGVFNQGGELVGVVAPHVTFSERPMDMHFVVPSNEIKKLLLNLEFTGESTNKQYSADFIPQNVNLAKRSLVSLQIGNVWASGILVSKDGHILTNAHLFKSFIPQLNREKPIEPSEYEDLRVNAYFPSSTRATKKKIELRVMYISHTHLDVALLQVNVRAEWDLLDLNATLQPARYSHDVDIAIGMPVWVVAHGFGPERGMDPICSYGVIGNVIYRDGVPSSLQTTASVHSGNSGGMLVNSDGALVGMVMSHTTHKRMRTITRLNFSIPFHQFETLINFSNGEDPLALNRLKQSPTDKFLASLWKFEEEPKEAPKVGPSFRKFIDGMQTDPPPPPPASTGDPPTRRHPNFRFSKL